MPRPSARPTGAVWALLKAWSLEHPLHPNQEQMAGLFEVSGSLLSSWKYMDSLMQADDMRLISEKTGIELGTIIEAVAEDAPTIQEHISYRRGQSKGRTLRATQDEQATAPDPEGPEGGA